MYSLISKVFEGGFDFRFHSDTVIQEKDGVLNYAK